MTQESNQDRWGARAAEPLALAEPPTLPEWATRPQVAEYLQVSVPTLARWAMEPGKGPRATRFGGAVRYSRADVLAWADAQRAGVAS